MNTTTDRPEEARTDLQPLAPENSEVSPDEATQAQEAAAAASEPTGQQTLGERLRSARESKGWSQEDVSNRLHLPVQVVQTLEAEQFEKIGYGIYLRGYLTSYARLVDVPAVLVDAVMSGRNALPPLVASGTISHSRYLYQRYSVSALYVILTGVIIVPAVLLAMRAGLQSSSVADLASLDVPRAVQPGPADAGATAEVPAAPAPAPTEPQANAVSAAASTEKADTPLVASIAPFSALGRKDNNGSRQVGARPAVRASAQAPVSEAPTRPATHTLKLILKEASWVEVVTASGRKLEYGLLPAGTTRTYTSGTTLEVRLGNSSGAEVEVDGKVQDLGPYRHANIAHFRLLGAGKAISPTDS